LDGDAATFTVQATGSEPRTYQWRLDGVPVPGATSSTYTLLAALADNGRLVSVTVSNAYGSATSAAAALVVDRRAPSVVAGPRPVDVMVGEAAGFAVTGAGSGPLQYQWERSRDGGSSWEAIAGAQSAAFHIPSATLGWADNEVRVKIINVAGTVATAAARLRVTPNVRILAGIPGGSGYGDGVGADARFDMPRGVLADAAGNLYVAEWRNAVIRKITPAGEVSTFAGHVLARGMSNGPREAARFMYPSALARDAAGNLYVGDHNAIRRIDAGGMVTTVAGGTSGSADGVGTAASFSDVIGISSDGAGNLTVLDGQAKQTVRKVSAAGVVTTVAGRAGQFGHVDGSGAQARFTWLTAVVPDGAGNHYVTDNHSIRKVAADGTVSRFAGSYSIGGDADGPRLFAQLRGPRGLAFDGAGNLYVASDAHIRRVGTDGNIVTLAGALYSPTGGGEVDGTGAGAFIHYAHGITALPDGSFAFTGTAQGTLRRVTAQGTVTTIAGRSRHYLQVDGPGASARFYAVPTLAADSQGRVVVPETPMVLRLVDAANQVTTRALNTIAGFHTDADAVDASGTGVLGRSDRITEVGPDGTTTLVAGVAGTMGHQDGPGSQAKFRFVHGLAVDAAGNVYVSDRENHVIRRVDGAGIVTTIAGLPGTCGVVDGVGAAARLCYPNGLAIDSRGRLVVAEDWTHTIRRIDPDGTVTTIGGKGQGPGLRNGWVSSFSGPVALAFDADDNLFIADRDNAAIRRMSPNGYTTTVMGGFEVHALRPGSGGAINAPAGLAVRPGGRLVLATEMAVVGD
jgi:sugar lactone lactonase YvrE